MRKMLVALVLVTAACAGSADPEQTGPPEDRPTTTQPEGGVPATLLKPAYGADGNRVAPFPASYDPDPAETMQLIDSEIARIDLPTDDTIAVGYESGELRIVDGTGAVKARPLTAPTGLVYTDGPAGVDVLPPLPDQALHGRPAVLDKGQLAYVTGAGDVVVWDGSEIARTAVDALPDGDVLVDEAGRLLLLTGPTERYAHGILGDAAEATGFVVLAPPDLTIVGSGTVTDPAVIEGRRAIWTDMDDDGSREVQLTVSRAGEGAALVVMNEAGEIVGETQPIGLSNRWRHQIAFGHFSTTPVSVEVITPHIGGTVTFRSFGDRLDRITSISGYTSHRIGSRELDMGVALDIDDDGLLELVVPSQDRRSLVAIGLAGGEAQVEWRAELTSPITSNVAVGTRDGVPTIAVGTRSGQIYLWQPTR